MHDKTIYCVSVTEKECDDFALIYTFDNFDDAAEFERLSLKNDYRCGIYTETLEDD